MSTGLDPGMSHAVRVRTSSQIGAVGRCPECIRAAMRPSVDVGGRGRVSRGAERRTGPGAGYDLFGYSVSPRVQSVKISEGFEAAAGRDKKTHLTFENLDAKGVDPMETKG